MRTSRRHVLWLLPLALIAALAAWAALAPLSTSDREQLFEIPKGTWARRMAGDRVDILPSTIHLTLGVKDVLKLRNLDSVPQIFGPVLIMPGQEFKLPFETVSENDFNCTAHSSGSMKVIVAAAPAPGLGRLRWRLAQVHNPR